MKSEIGKQKTKQWKWQCCKVQRGRRQQYQMFAPRLFFLKFMVATDRAHFDAKRVQEMFGGVFSEILLLLLTSVRFLLQILMTEQLKQRQLRACFEYCCNWIWTTSYFTAGILSFCSLTIVTIIAPIKTAWDSKMSIVCPNLLFSLSRNEFSETRFTVKTHFSFDRRATEENPKMHTALAPHPKKWETQ